MSSVLAVALPVFAVIAAGLLAGRLEWMNAGDSAALNKFVFRFAMPAALFGLTAGTAPPGAEDLTIVIAYGAASLIVIFGVYFLARPLFGLTRQESGAHAVASTLGNAVFLGLPIALSVDGWARPFVTLMLIEGTIIIAISSALIAPQKEQASPLARLGGYVMRPFKNPLVIGMAAGFVYSAIGLPFSGPAETFFSLLGRAAGPTALFSLGLFLVTHPLPPIASVAGRIGAITIAKMVALPMLTLALASMLGLRDPHYLGALALFVFVPSGVVSFVMASQNGIYKSETAAAVSFTTILSVLTISAVLVVFG